MPRRNFLITKKALAQYLHISRNTVARRLRASGVDINNMNAVLDYIVDHTPKRFVPRIVGKVLQEMTPCPICKKDYEQWSLTYHMQVHIDESRLKGDNLNIPKLR